MVAINRVTIAGNLGRDPEIRSLNNGDKVANFSVAVTEKWTDARSGERKERTEWVPVTVYGGSVNFIEQYIHKGDAVYVEGRFQTRKWEDQSGTERYTTEVVVQGFGGTVQILTSRGQRDGGEEREHNTTPASRQSAAPARKPAPPKQARYDDLDDSIPF